MYVYFPKAAYRREMEKLRQFQIQHSTKPKTLLLLR